MSNILLNMRKTAVVLMIILFLSGSYITFSAGADWPMFRNDVTYSGVSNITGNKRWIQGFISILGRNPWEAYNKNHCR